MKKMELSIVVILLLVCIVAFSLPFVVTNATAQKLYSSDLVIPNTGLGSLTPTPSTERAMTIAAFAELFVTPTNTPALSDTFTATATSTFTLTFSPTATVTRTNTPTLTASPTATPVPPTITNRPREDEVRPTNPPPPQPTKEPDSQPTSPPPTNPPPIKTNPPPTVPPPQEATPPPPPDPTEPPVAQSVLEDLIDIFQP